MMRTRLAVPLPAGAPYSQGLPLALPGPWAQLSLPICCHHLLWPRHPACDSSRAF